MILRHVASCGLMCTVLASVGCDQGRQTPGQVTVRVANVAPGFEALGYLREQAPRESPATLAFKGGQLFSYEADTYDFFVFERSLVATAPGRIWSFARELRENLGYTFVLTEAAGEISPVVLEYPLASVADAQIVALHAAPGLPAMDLYLERPGAGIGGATPRGTLTAGGQLASRTLPTGDYELWLTAAGNPTNVLLTSSTIALVGGETAAFIVTPEAGTGTATMSVLVLQANLNVLYDRNAPAEIRVINGAADTLPRDFAINRAFTPPLFSAMPFATPTAYGRVPVAAAQPINVTPPGNPGVFELDQTFATSAGQRWTLLVAGATGTLLHTPALDDGRRFQKEAKIRFYNAANQFPLLDFVVVEPGASPNEFAAITVLGVPGLSTFIALAGGEYDLYTRQPGASVNTSGPTRISVAAQGIYGALAVNGLDTATTRILLLDDFP